MTTWILVVALGLLTHFGASYLIPLAEKDQGAFGGLLRWAWPWGIGDHGFLGRVDPNAMPITGFWIAMAAAALSLMALLAVLGIWIPTGWWRALAIAGASLIVVLMVGFFGPTKILPIVVALAVLWAATVGADTFDVG